MGHINLLMTKNQQNHNHQSYGSVCHPTVPKNCCSLHDPLHCLDEGWRNSRSCKGLHKGPSRWSLSGVGIHERRVPTQLTLLTLLAPPAEKIDENALWSHHPHTPNKNTANSASQSNICKRGKYLHWNLIKFYTKAWTMTWTLQSLPMKRSIGVAAK